MGCLILLFIAHIRPSKSIKMSTFSLVSVNGPDSRNANEATASGQVRWRRFAHLVILTIYLKYTEV